MILKPLHFKTAQDFNNFISALKMSGLIIIETKGNQQYLSIPSESELGKNLLKGQDEHVYFLDDVKHFLKDATEEEIKASTITFSTPTTKRITLSDLKEYPITRFSELEWSREPLVLMSLLNLSLYFTDTFPVLSTTEEIKNAKATFGNIALHQFITITYSLMELRRKQQIMTKIYLETANNIPVTIPKIRSPNIIIKNLNIDLLKITLIQEIKLKAHLLQHIASVKNKEEKELLNQWIDELSKNGLTIKAIFKFLLDSLNEQQAKIESAKTKYQQIIAEDPVLEKTHKQIKILTDDLKYQNKQYVRQESLFQILKPFTVYSILIGLPLLTLALLLLLPPLFIPLLTFAIAQIVIGFALILTGILMITTSLGDTVFNSIFNLKKGIENLFSLEEKLSKIESIKAESSALQSNVNFVTAFAKVEKSLNQTYENIKALKNEFEDDLQEIAQIEIIEQTKNIPSEEKTHSSLKDMGLFKRRNSSPNQPTAQADDEQAQELPRSRSLSL